MNFKKISVILFFTGLAIASVSSQQPDFDQIISTITQNINTQTLESIHIDQYIQTLHEIAENPININTAGEEDFVKLGFLSSFQIFSLLEHRKKQGDFLTIYEIPSVIGFDIETATLLQHFITFEESKGANVKNREIRGVFLARAGDNFSSYKKIDDLGKTENWRLYSKLNMKLFGKIGFNITTENDPGEVMFNDTISKGPDFLSASLSFHDLGPVKDLIVGDYNLNINQGLMIWTGYGAHKGSAGSNISKSASTISKYTSVNEINFLRGVAFTLNKKSVETTLFYSDKQIDGELVSSLSDSAEYYFSSIHRTGLHQTENEINKQDQINEKLFGISGGLSRSNLKLNIATLCTRYNYLYKPKEIFYLLNESQGKAFVTLSFGYQYMLKNIELFGEEVYQPTTGKYAGLNGIVIRPAEELSTTLVYRNYQSGYSNLYAKGFAEYSGTTNEEGLFIAAEFSPSSEWEFSGFADYFNSHWARYNISNPSTGKEYGTRIFYGTYDFSMYLQYKYQGKYENIPLEVETGEKTRQFAFREQQSLRVHSGMKINSSVYCQTRLEMKNYFSGSTSPGYLLYYDLNYSPRDRSSFSVRYSYFNSEDFDSRIYTYEKDVLYSLSMPAYYGKGYKVVLNTKIRFTNKLNVWVKYGFQKQFESKTGYLDKSSNHEIKIQAGWRF